LQVRHVLMAVVMAVVFGLGWVFAKAALGHFPPILLAAFRFGVTALCLVWFAKPVRGQMWELSVISLLAVSIPYSMSYTGMRDLDVSTAVLLAQLEAPCLILLGALLLHERPTWRQIVGMIVAVGGVILVAGDPAMTKSLIPALWVIGSIVIWAVGQIRIRRLGDTGVVTLIAWVSALASPQLFIGSAILERDQLRIVLEASWEAWSAVIYLGVVMTALGIGLWYHLIGKYPVVNVGPFLLLVPAISSIGGVTMLGEDLTTFAVIGGCVIVAGVACVVTGRTPTVARQPEAA
jgi:O-acetylserine/cysteine efflux transporter